MPRFGGMGGAFGHMGGGGLVPSTAAAAFTPLSLTPALWIDPSDTTTMFQSNAGTTAVTDGSVCGYAGDKSGNAFHLNSAADDTTRPTWNNNSGLPYLNFDGVNDVLLRTASLGIYAAAGVSIFVAVKANPTASFPLIGESSSSSNNPIYFMRSNGLTASSAAYFLRNDANTIINNDSPSETNAFDNTDNVIGMTDSTSNVQFYTDGVAGASASVTRSGTLTVDRFSLAASVRTTTSQWFLGRVYGLVIVKRVLTAGEIASLTTYLGAKMGRVL